MTDAELRKILDKPGYAIHSGREGRTSTPREPEPIIRQSAGDGMNQWEREYLAHLQAANPAAFIHREVALPLANGVKYKVDFLVYCPTANRVFGHEVKGFRRSTGIVKIKVAARVFPWITFFLVTKRRKKDGGGWNPQEIRP